MVVIEMVVNFLKIIEVNFTEVLNLIYTHEQTFRFNIKKRTFITMSVNSMYDGKIKQTQVTMNKTYLPNHDETTAFSENIKC